MTKEEFVVVKSALTGFAGAAMTDQEEAGYLFFLGGYEMEAVLRAVRAYGGQTYRPSASELVKALQPGRAGAPTFKELRVLIFGSNGIFAGRPAPRGLWLEGEREAEMKRLRDERIARLPEIVQSFVYSFGVKELRNFKIDDLDEGQWRERELEGAWLAHLEKQDERRAAAHASGDRDGLRRLDPLAALGVDKRPELDA